MTEKILLRGRKVVGGIAEGEALVTKQTISSWGGVDAEEGTITERRHELRGMSFAGKVLVFPSAKGSSGWSTVAQAMRLAGKSPTAMLIGRVNSLTAIGAIVMRVPVLTDFDKNPVEFIDSGDWVRVDGDSGVVEVTKKE